MKFFIDTANLDHIREACTWGVIDGVTTNPSLIAKEGGNFVEQIAEICTLVDGPVSAETVAESAEDMVRQGKLLARVHDNVIIKVPLTEEGIKACAVLSSEGIGVNVTLCFQAAQALLAAKAGARFISPFLGRIDDIAGDGVQLIDEIVGIYSNYEALQTEVLAASIRHPLHLIQVAQAGSDVATVPYGVLKKLFVHPLTDSGNERFTQDWLSVPNPDVVELVTDWLERNGR